MELNIGVNTIDIRNSILVTIDVTPVLPPLCIPAPLSTNVVTGDNPNNEPTIVPIASVLNAVVCPSKSPVLGSIIPANDAILYNVPVVSNKSTYKNVNNANHTSQSNKFKSLNKTNPVFSIVWNSTICLKKSNLSFPSSLSGKYVNVVPRNHDSILTNNIPIITPPLISRIVRYAITKNPAIPIHVVAPFNCVSHVLSTSL
mmetsp:Transcript_14996/g.18377  ORF Transcript_14996/g.18377 Transcript_14996/m.18377 type:complete len:201 (-) Transcript_14996:235-837(-)